MIAFFFLIIFLVLKRILPEVVGDIFWPRLLGLRLQGPAGLFLSWLAYYLILGVIGLLFIEAFVLLGGRVTSSPWEYWVLALVPLAAALFQTIRKQNPSRYWDEWAQVATTLIERCQEEDLRLLTVADSSEPLSSPVQAISEGSPSPAYIDHLRRVIRAVDATEDVDLTGKAMALEMLADRVRLAEDALQASRNSERPN